MFSTLNTGATAMTILDLGPVFNRIPENNTDMFKNTGTNELIVYAFFCAVHGKKAR